MGNDWVRNLRVKVSGNLHAQAIAVGLLMILPFALYVLATDSIIAPLNGMSGWDVSSAKESVLAPVISDVNQQMLPFRQYIKDSLTSSNELPLWNTRSFAGDAFLANPINTVLSPFNLFLFFLDIYTLQNIIVLSGLFMMGYSMFLLLRSLDLSKKASIVGSVAYTYAPFSVFWSIYGVVSIPMSAIPLSIFFYNRWKVQNNPLNTYLFAVATTLGVATYFGHIQIVILPYIILSLKVVYDLISSSLALKKALYLGLGAGVALLIGLAQIAPLVTQTPLSHRTNETETFSPKPWGDRVTELLSIPSSYDLSSGPDNLGALTRRSLSVGQIPGILFLLSIGFIGFYTFRQRKIGEPLFYIILFVIGASWQWNDFPQTVLNLISPTFRSLATDYFLPIALLGMAVLSAYSFDWLLNSLFSHKPARSSRIHNIISIALLTSVIVMTIPQLMLSRVDTLNNAYFGVLYVLLIGSFLYWWWMRSRVNSHIFSGVTLCIIALMHGWALYRVSQPIVPKEITNIKDSRLNFITSANTRESNMIVDYSGPQESAFYNVSLINGYDSLYSSSLLHRIQAINYPNITPKTYRNNSLVINNQIKPTLFKNLGVSYTINKQPTEGYIEVYDKIYKADQPTPQVYFAKKVSNQSTKMQLETIKRGDVDYHEIIIEGNYPIADASSTVKYHRTPNTLTLETSSPNGGLLFINQTFNKDWRAIIDGGLQLPLLSAYYDFSALNIPKGKHTILLTYSPKIVYISFWVSSISLIGSVVALVILKRYRRS